MPSEPVVPGGPHPPPEAALLGRQVRVVLNRGEGREPDVVVHGRLLTLSAMGEFTVEGDDGDVHWCWPWLEVQLDEPPGVREPQ